MSIFGSIGSKIFGHASANAAPASNAPQGSASASSTSPAQPAGGTSSFNNPAAQTGSPGQSTQSTSSSAPQSSGGQNVDVAAVLTELASKNSQTLDWRHSIVDLMKLLDLDSSLSARQELAKELHYTGSTSDSAAMNIWLHKQVMQKLAENGGKVPDELKN